MGERMYKWIGLGLVLLGWVAPPQVAIAGAWGFRSEASADVFNQGWDSLTSGLTDLARAQFEQAAKQDKSSDLPQFGLGMVYLHENRPAEADEIFRKLRRDHQDGTLLVSMVKASMAQSKTDEAVLRVQEAIALYPARPDVVQMYIILSLNAGDLKGPEDALQRARAVQDEAIWSCLEVAVLAEQRLVPQAQNAMERCRGVSEEHDSYRGAALARLALLDPTSVATINEKLESERDPLEKIFREVQELINEKKSEEAIARLKTLGVRYPKNPYLMYLHSTVLQQKGDYAAANRERERLFSTGESIEVWNRGELMGVRSPQTRKIHRQNIASASILHVLYNTEQGGQVQGKQALDVAEKWLGDCPAIQASKIYLVFHGGDRSVAWSQLQALLKQPWDFLSKRSMGLLLETMVREDPHGVPSQVLDWLMDKSMWHIRYNRASAWYNAKKYTDCWADLGTLQVQDKKANGVIQDLAYGCAVAAGNAAGASTKLKEAGGVNRVTFSRVLSHGWLLAEEKAHEEGLSLLGGLAPADRSDEEKMRLHRLKLFLLVDSKQTDKALLIADGSVPETEYNLAVQLYNAQRFQEALTVLNRACPNAKPDFAADCSAFLKEANEAKDASVE